MCFLDSWNNEKNITFRRNVIAKILVADKNNSVSRERNFSRNFFLASPSLSRVWLKKKENLACPRADGWKRKETRKKISSIGEVHCQNSSESTRVPLPGYFFWKRDSPDETIRTKGKCIVHREVQAYPARVGEFASGLRKNEDKSISMMVGIRDEDNDDIYISKKIVLRRDRDGWKTKTAFFRVANHELLHDSRHGSELAFQFWA